MNFFDGPSFHAAVADVKGYALDKKKQNVKITNVMIIPQECKDISIEGAKAEAAKARRLAEKAVQKPEKKEQKVEKVAQRAEIVEAVKEEKREKAV